MTADDKHCATCRYSERVGTGIVTCSYILIVGRRRGCPSGLKCERYAPITEESELEKVQRLRAYTQQLFERKAEFGGEGD